MSGVADAPQGDAMKEKLGRRIERHMNLRYFVDSKRWQVETRKPLGRRWVYRTYTPTPASLERVKKVVGFQLGMNGWWGAKSAPSIKEYSITQ